MDPLIIDYDDLLDTRGAFNGKLLGVDEIKECIPDFPGDAYQDYFESIRFRGEPFWIYPPLRT